MALIQTVAGVGDSQIVSAAVNPEQPIWDVLAQSTGLGSGGLRSFASWVQSLPADRQQQIRQAILAYDQQLAGYQRAVLSAWNIYLNKHRSMDPAAMFGQWKDRLGSDINQVNDQRRLLTSMRLMIPK